MSPSPQRVLALGAHTDDIELGCGAALSRLSRNGAEIQVLAFSVAEESLPAGSSPDTLEHEFRASMAVLGLPTTAVHVKRFPVRRLNEHRQDVLELLVALNRNFKPDLVLTMNSADSHQDHEVVHAESVRAFRNTTLLGYETPWNQVDSHGHVFMEVSEHDVAVKIDMLGCYASQAALGRTYVDPDYVRAAALVNGVRGKLPLAEVFEVLKLRWSEE